MSKDKLLNELHIMDGYETVKGIPKEFTQKTARAKAYLKGIFLSCGALSVPNDKDAQAYEGRKGYHLEFNLGTDLIVKDLITLICKLSGIEPRSVKQRKNSPSVYIKSAQSISDCLAAMGAAKAVLMLQQVMVNRAMRNHLNRGNNFILANIDKSVNASRKQTEAIQRYLTPKGKTFVGQPPKHRPGKIELSRRRAQRNSRNDGKHQKQNQSPHEKNYRNRKNL